MFVIPTKDSAYGCIYAIIQHICEEIMKSLFNM